MKSIGRFVSAKTCVYIPQVIAQKYAGGIAIGIDPYSADALPGLSKKD